MIGKHIKPWANSTKNCCAVFKTMFFNPGGTKVEWVTLPV